MCPCVLIMIWQFCCCCNKKRLDVFQDELFELFTKTRARSYFEAKASNSAANKFKIHRFGQLYKDAYELQRYFMQKRDELCRNGELLNSPALSYKPHALDSHIASLVGTSDPNFDENDALLVDDRYRPLESSLTGTTTGGTIRVGNYYLLSRDLVKSGMSQFESVGKSDQPLIVCVLAHDASHFVGQVYLQPDDEEFIPTELRRLRRCFASEVLKTDMYTKIEIKHAEAELAKGNCLVIGIRQYVTFEANFDTAEDSDQPVVQVKPERIFVCESYFSTAHKYFRKLGTKKWSPLACISSAAAPPEPSTYNFTFTKRATPLQVERNYPDQAYIDELCLKFDTRMVPLFANKNPQRSYFRETIQLDTLPSAAKDLDDNEGGTGDDDLIELAKTCRFYEQVNVSDELYKLGEFVYIKYQQLSSSQPARDELKLPLIVRIDRLWAPKNQTGDKTQYFFKGPVFLRSTDIPHEPTRLFYRNEVFKEMSRQLTSSLDDIVDSPMGSKQRRCIVMSARRYATRRSTEIDERDVYVCEAKFNLQTRLFRKFTKELKSFKLSARCLEDEIYVLRRDLQLRKHLSPLLVTLEIDYDDQSAEYLRDFNDPQSQQIDEANATALGTSILNERSGMGAGDESTRDGIDSSHDENSQMEMASPLAATTAERTPRPANSKVSFHIENGVSSSSAASGLTGSASSTKIKKERKKAPKKSGFNMFSKEFRKSLRDTKSSLSFIDMSKEVGIRWRALSDKQRAEYEQKAIIATLREKEKFEGLFTDHFQAYFTHPY